MGLAALLGRSSVRRLGPVRGSRTDWRPLAAGGHTAMSERYDARSCGGRPGDRAALLERRLGCAVLLEKGPSCWPTSSHNSGVVHAGLYYQAGSRKARLCREGKAELERFAASHSIPLERCGKLVVAVAGGGRGAGAAGRANGARPGDAGTSVWRDRTHVAAWPDCTAADGDQTSPRWAGHTGGEVRGRGGELVTGPAWTHAALPPGARSGCWPRPQETCAPRR
jgi:hypothetical protein